MSVSGTDKIVIKKSCKSVPNMGNGENVGLSVKALPHNLIDKVNSLQVKG
uniref:Uncharacterized protein n=1 Tax=Arion vulgaris TaxID=1028688 RepID=A0A0B7BLD7_9EUPU